MMVMVGVVVSVVGTGWAAGGAIGRYLFATCKLVV